MSMEAQLLETDSEVEISDRRSDEREAFSKVTVALENSSVANLGSALDDNRRLWSILQDNLHHEDNLLPEELKSQLISLASWVHSYTDSVIEGEGELEALISINRTIMEGLA